MHDYDASNARILSLLSDYLTFTPRLIAKDAMAEMAALGGISQSYAFSMLLAAGCGLDMDVPDDKALYHHYFPEMVHRLDATAFIENPYHRSIQIPQAALGGIALTHQAYAPFEAFVCNDLVAQPDGRIIPQIGYFDTEFAFPAILEDGRVWMTITPNEIETMRAPIAASHGRVLALGLGLGYFAFMASEKESVECVTVVEQNGEVIRLFEKHILPQFPNAKKIRIEKADAFAYLDAHATGGRYDVVFADLWHDVGDGLEMYLRIKAYEERMPGTLFQYWIEPSIRCHL